MTTRHRTLRSVLGLIAMVSSLFGMGWLGGSAHAIIGRPLTPMSYAGVARRTTRRAVVFGAAAAPVYAAPPVYAPPPPPYYW